MGMNERQNGDNRGRTPSVVGSKTGEEERRGEGGEVCGRCGRQACSVCVESPNQAVCGNGSCSKKGKTNQAEQVQLPPQERCGVYIVNKRHVVGK